jgi:hypothetical protein
MSRIVSTPFRRIALAVALSMLVHGMALWIPKIKLPEKEIKLQPLIAKLVPLPRATGKIVKHKPKRKASPAPQPEPVVQAQPEPSIAESTPVAASEVAAASEPVAASAPQAASEPVAAEPAASAPVAADAEPQRPQLPKHAQLNFAVYMGEKALKVGESIQKLDISEGRYTLMSKVYTTGIVRVFKTFSLEQFSTGTATSQTLTPEEFTDVTTQSSGKQINHAIFDWANHKIRFSSGQEAALPQQAQDILSILYQFPILKPQEEFVSINIGTGKKFETFRFEIAFEEKLDTAMGTLQTVHFRKMHKAHEEGLEIWFSQEYRLFPVKIRHLDKEGKIDGEAIITDIRVSDE